MNWLTYFKRSTLALIIVLISVNLWGQSLSLLNPESPNSETNPYLIGSASDWNLLVFDVNDDTDPYTYEGDYIKLTADIEVEQMVGTDANGFSGIFDGMYNNVVNTITFNYPNATFGAAPFYDTYNATIKNLKVVGSIDASFGGDAAGLIFKNYEATTVSNVTVSVNITAPNQAKCAGFAVYNDKYYAPGVLTFTNCVYNGQIVAGANSGGFWASQGDGTATFENCIFDPAEGSTIESGATFATNSTSWTGCYYTSLAGTSAQGTLAYQTAPADDFTKAVTYNGYTVYGHVGVTLPNVAATYEYNNGEAITVNCAVTFDDPNITSGDYTVKIYKDGTEVEQVKDCGKHDVVVAGTGSKGSYYGAYSQSFYVIKPLSGNGEEGTPYIIASAEDWISFAYYVSQGNSYSGKYVHLTNSITVSTMVGTPEHPFSGDFSGQAGEHAAHTLTFNYGTSANPTTEEIVAPFRYTDGATIHSLIVDGAIYTNVGKEAGLIGVNTSTSGNNTTVQFVINNVNFICYEDLLDAEGGGYAYDGSGISFIYSSYEGTISANNYHGGFCGNADAATTSFSNCLFNPTDSGFYWAENFVYNLTGTPSNTYFNTCYYTVGHNQEESEQGTMVFVNTVPEGNIGHKLTTFHEKVVYEPVTVEISGVNKRYTYTGNDITITPSVTFNGTNALGNNYCEWSITPSNPMHDVGQYTFTLTAPKTGATGEALKYLGTIKQIIRVVESSSAGWTALQNALSSTAPDITINLSEYLTTEYPDRVKAGSGDACLVIEGEKTVTINLNGYTIDRGFYDAVGEKWEDPVIGGQVLKIASDATVIINGPGTIMGGCNKAPTSNEHAENSDAGGIFNMGSLTLINVTVEGNYCQKRIQDVSRTARGGAIYSGKGSTLIIDNCTITHNKAEGGGGGLFVEKASVFEMDNTNVRSNTTQDKGGGVRVNADGTKHDNGAKTLVNGALINKCVIENNLVELHNPQSASNGGGIHLDAGTLYLTNSTTVKNNRCSKFGGGIYQMGGTIIAENCSINNNSSYDVADLFEGCGGGVCVLGGTFKMVGGTITGNSSYKTDGGGIYVASGRTLNLQGSVNIYGNWTVDEAWNQHTTNVYLAGANGRITISGSIVGASVGVSKNGETGIFTNGLNGKGTIANFVSDYAAYQVLPDGNEAKLGVPAEMPSDVDDLHLPDGIEKVGDEYVIKVPFTVDQPVVILRSVRFEEDGCIIITENGILRVPSITNSDPLKIIVEDGGQIIFTGAPGNVAARVKKDVLGFEKVSYSYWYLISSPVNNPAIATATNIVTLNPVMVEPTPGYDLYRFNEAATAYDAEGDLLHWENYRNEAYHGESPTYPFDNMTNGRGYLYRSCQDYTLTIDGDLNVGDVTSYTLTNSNTPNIILKGFNIIGNPYPHNIKKGEGQAIPNDYLEEKYYVLNPEGCVWTLKTDAEEISPFTGILVQAKSEVSATQTLTISDVVASAAKGGIDGNNNIWFTVANSKYEDKACVEFKQGHGLNKIAHINEEAPMLYINYNGEDFASVDMNPEARYFNLNFEAKTTGMYTLSVQPQGDYSYLHLYDKLTGKDVDLLLDNEYSFVGSTTDAADRFTIVLNPSTSADSENEIFAYQSGNEIIVNGKGELQIFDVMGRMVAIHHVNDVQAIEKPSTTGVYIMRLNGMTQKIVIK